MSLSDFISLLAISVSLISLFVTLYFQYLRGSRVRAFTSKTMEVFYSNEHSINLMIDVVLLNEGARPCIIENIQCILSNGAQKLTLVWFGFFVSTDANNGDLTQGIRKFYRYDSAAEMFSLNGYQVEKKKIGFAANSAGLLTNSGQQTLEFQIFTSVNPKKPILKTIHFNLSPAELTKLAEEHTADEHNVINTTFSITAP